MKICQNCDTEMPKSNPGDKVVLCPICGFVIRIELDANLRNTDSLNARERRKEGE